MYIRRLHKIQHNYLKIKFLNQQAFNIGDIAINLILEVFNGGCFNNITVNLV